MARQGTINVVGVHWGAYLERGSLMPITEATAAYTYSLGEYELENIGKFTRENVQDWLDTHAGDFSVIKDFEAASGEVEIPWASEESDCLFFNMMYGDAE